MLPDENLSNNKFPWTILLVLLLSALQIFVIVTLKAPFFEVEPVWMKSVAMFSQPLNKWVFFLFWLEYRWIHQQFKIVLCNSKCVLCICQMLQSPQWVCIKCMKVKGTIDILNFYVPKNDLFGSSTVIRGEKIKHFLDAAQNESQFLLLYTYLEWRDSPVLWNLVIAEAKVCF